MFDAPLTAKTAIVVQLKSFGFAFTAFAIVAALAFLFALAAIARIAFAVFAFAAFALIAALAGLFALAAIAGIAFAIFAFAAFAIVAAFTRFGLCGLSVGVRDATKRQRRDRAQHDLFLRHKFPTPV